MRKNISEFDSKSPQMQGHMFGRLYRIEKGERIQMHSHSLVLDNSRPEEESEQWIINERLSKHIEEQFNTLPQDYTMQVEFGGDGGDGQVEQTFLTDNKKFDFAIPLFRTKIQGTTYLIEFQDQAEWDDE